MHSCAHHTHHDAAAQSTLEAGFILARQVNDLTIHVIAGVQVQLTFLPSSATSVVCNSTLELRDSSTPALASTYVRVCAGNRTAQQCDDLEACQMAALAVRVCVIQQVQASCTQPASWWPWEYMMAAASKQYST